ncbi:acyl-CoA dehydrogenase family protein [Kitasatospora sp. SUK 42]|uniref:acyl-CoA dehydrogenase family protein n=1 Tax=Kitasatospora sp. SUK 42 TaxID=1588882 RepID=UPI0018C9B930|nr:acyl-CoA dehydrogenase family protein [Kitasatospora sp. SUK 42]MBV2156010.1 acyl-CoA/acyl-ACP dehydrogenase [Kitasatospora sp. SUK 42]
MTITAATDRPSDDRSPNERSSDDRSTVERPSNDRRRTEPSNDRGRDEPSGSGHSAPDRSAVEAALAGLPRVVDLLAARAEEHDRDATFPYQGIEAVHEAGLLTLTVSERYGGPGGTLADTVRVLAQLGRGDASVAVVTACTLLQHAEQARRASWPTAGYRRLLTESRRGPALVNTLRAEPGGRPGELPGTVARRDGSGWLLTGRKTYCTGAEALAWMAVTARTDEPEPRVGTFLVRGESEGLEIDPTWDQLGLRASASHDVVLDRVRVPAELALGLGTPARQDDAEVQLARAWHDLALSAVAIGVARAAESWLVRFLNQRTPANLTEPLGTLPRYRCALGEIEAQLIGAEELVAGLAPRVDRGEPDAVARTGPAHLLATRAATAAVQQAVALTGNPGLSRRHPLERYLRDVLSSRVHLAPDETVLEAAGRAALERGARP